MLRNAWKSSSRTTTSRSTANLSTRRDSGLSLAGLALGGASMIRTTLLLAAIAAAATIVAAPAGAQLNQDHGQYSRADIEAGQRLYGPQCQVCHGATGDGIPGIDLRLGKFRRVTS